jgi:divalent metal cation (Fe/Co/Zn/Cd) transporter
MIGQHFASGFILFNAYLIFRPALGEIMDEMYDELIEKIREVSNQVEELLILLKKCFIRKAGMKYHGPACNRKCD